MSLIANAVVFLLIAGYLHSAFIEIRLFSGQVAAKQLVGELEPLLSSLEARMFMLALLLLLGSTFLALLFFHRFVRQPLRRVIKRIAEIEGVGAMVDGSTDISGGDEWATVDYALKSMRTELASRHDAVRRSEARYKLLVENQGDMIVKLDSEGHFEFVSPTYCSTFGKTQSELLGSISPITLLAKGEGEQGRTMMDLYRPPYECLLEQRSLTTKGWRWFSWNHRALLNEQGQVSAIIGVGRDVTDRKLAELELERQRRFLHTVIDSVADPILVIGRDYRIRMYNTAAVRSYAGDEGMDPADMHGFCHKVTHGAEAPCHHADQLCPLQQVLETGQATTVLHR
ncbi:MAG: PAS domain S-box protein, partial [Gammaproteobacteria bacterium]|nr:PAS domain S-box protein [Gammaproteobacteria bacterium]